MEAVVASLWGTIEITFHNVSPPLPSPPFKKGLHQRCCCCPNAFTRYLRHGEVRIYWQVVGYTHQLHIFFSHHARNVQHDGKGDKYFSVTELWCSTYLEITLP